MLACRVVRTTICLGLTLAGFRTIAAAQSQDRPDDPRVGIPQSVGFSINNPIDIPGGVLKPGAYVLRIKSGTKGQNANEKLNLVEVLDGQLNLDEAQKHVVAEIYAKQVYDPSRADGPLLSYYVGASGRRALKAWSHFPTYYIEQFVYSPEQAAEISKTTGAMVLSMSSVPAPAKSQVASEPSPPARAAPPTPPPSNEAKAPVPAAAQQSRAAPPARGTLGGPVGGSGDPATHAPPATGSPAPTNPAAPSGAAKTVAWFPRRAGDLPIAVWLGLTALVALLLFNMYRRDPVEMQNARNNAQARRIAAAAYRSYKLARSPAAGRQHEGEIA